MKKITLLRGEETFVDDEDFEVLSQYKWGVLNGRRTKYVKRMYGPKAKRQCILMHRMIMDAPKGMEVDHIDRNGLNNQRSNLRISTPSQNRCNQVRFNPKKTSSYKGVSWNSSKSKWVANIQFNRKYRNLGSFVNEVDAAMVYDSAAIFYHKEFAKLNLEY